MSEWDGVERRVGDSVDRFSRLLKQHTEDEMDRYDQIITKINANDHKSEARHDETQSRLNHLSQSIENFMAEQSLFHEAIKRAFPRDEDGHPDYDGHRSAHLSWIKSSAEEKEFKNYVKRVVAAGVAIGVLSWLWAVVWPAFLHGPK